MADVLKKVPVREQDPKVRATNFEEVCYGYNQEEAMEEASRCINCKNAKCIQGCPVGINIPAFVHEVKEGNIEEAYKIIGQSSALPAVCGRVCPQESQCEGKCIRGIKGESISIGKLERFVADYALEHDIKPDIISGVSAGALAGVFYADGNEPHQVIEYFSGHKFQDLTKLVIPKKGLFDLCEFIDFLHTNLKAKNLEELQIPLIITATDLDHGRMVHFHRGSIAERVAASCCMPVMFAPVNIDGTNYVDGGLMMNLPVSTLRRICDKVVAVNVSPIMAQDYKMNIVSIAMRSFHFMFRANTFPEREKCDLLIEPYNLYGYSNTELEKAEEIFEQGYKIANDLLDQTLAEKGKIWK